MKGAPERVLAKCTTYLKDGQALPITDDFRKAYDDAYNVNIPLHPISE
jgi:sodium/potassium-transporting ATPase subunit alpha